MAAAIEEYALIGNTRTAALISREGSLDWMCMPRFDSPACFASLLGTADHGRWLLAPAGGVRNVKRRYREGTLVLETDYECEGGAVRVTDCMPLWPGRSDVVRVVRGLRGQVPIRMELVIRFEYGSAMPWVEREGNGALRATAGPESLRLRTVPEVEIRPEGFKSVATFTIGEREMIPFTLSHFPSNEMPPLPVDSFSAIEETSHWWSDWSAGSTYRGDYSDLVQRSLITLKALTYAPTGGIVAAPTTSLPEQPGGVRNWDYRYCWLRDATFTLYALLIAGYHEEAQQWREWLLRAAAGHPRELRILYGIAGERHLPECELDWLPGYGGASPVRIGNGASRQLQLDVFGELMDAFHVARAGGIQADGPSWNLQRVLMDYLESEWDKPDNGIWEVRGELRHFTYSKVMAWVAADRAVKAVERYGLDGGDGGAEKWRALRKEIHDQVCKKGYDADRKTFVQSYGSKALDASLLLMPLVGFLPPEDPRLRGTVEAIERDLLVDGFVLRYRSEQDVDGLPAGEGVFLPCSFWLADNLLLQGRRDDARKLFERLTSLCNDVGLISEEYDPKEKCLLGNFPQAFTHVMLVNSARNLSRAGGPCEHRSRDGELSD